MKMLRSILPDKIIKRLQNGEKFVADSHQHVAVLFTGTFPCWVQFDKRQPAVLACILVFCWFKCLKMCCELCCRS
jgi:hypothetical protein